MLFAINLTILCEISLLFLSSVLPYLNRIYRILPRNSSWEKTYKGHVPRALYRENFSKEKDKKKVMYNLSCDQAKIWQNVYNKSILHVIGSKDFVLDLHKLVLFHLMECLPFNLPHTIYLNIMCITNSMDSLEDIYYVALLNRIF